VNDLSEKSCKPCEGGVAPLNIEQLRVLMQELPDWKLSQAIQAKVSQDKAVNENEYIYRDFEFKNYYKTMAFVNAVAWIAHHENHHPDLEVGYNRCRVKYSTHAIAGLSENDFICAAKVDCLLR
jgi:4a-hydroxytetrahydrobiopterin dehydratase